MKILHIIDHIGLGGAQRVVEGILEKYEEKNKIYCYALRKKDIKIINDKNIFIRNTGFKFDLLSLFEIKKIIEREKIQVLHCHLPRAFLIGWLLKKIFFKSIRIIFHEHGKIFRNSKIYNFFLRYTKNKVDLFIAVSKVTEQKLVENAGIPEEKIKVLYNFADLEKFNLEVLKKYEKGIQRERLGIKKNDFVIGFAGRLVKRKGWEEFIKSAKILSEKNLKLKFLVAGNGPDEQKLINLIGELNLTDKLLYMGFISDMLFFYSMLNCFVIPSHGEAMPFAELEAQACGIPVIASDVSALNEIIKDNKTGLLFKPKESEDLAKKIEAIYKDKKLRKKLRKNGLESVQKYSLNNYLMNLEDIYNKLYSRGIKEKNFEWKY